MSELKSKRAPSVSSNERAWEQVYDDINDIIKAVNNESGVESRNSASGKDGDIRLFKDVDRTKYFIEGRFNDGWAKRELIFSDTSDAGQDESINFSATESYIKPDGTVDFTAAQIGVTPTNNNHLATKQYVDNNATSFELTGNVTGGTSGAATVATTIATNAITQAMMQNDSVGTNEILNSNVTYAKIQNVSATDRVLGRNSSGAGVVEEITPTQLAAIVAQAQSAGNDQDMFLAGTGVFREPSMGVTVAGISDTVISSLADNHFLYYDYNSVSDTGFWRNRLLVASDIPSINISSGTTGTLPVNRGGTGATSGYNSSNWNTAYGWGDHGAAGYMSSFIITETDAGTSTINNGKYVKFASSNSGTHGNSTVTGSGSSGDPFVVTLNTPDTNTNQLTTFTIQGDSGSSTVNHGETVDIAGGNGISTTESSNTVTINATGNLPTLAGLSATTGNFIVASGGSFTVQSGATARATLGLGTAATQNTSAFLASDATGASEWTVSGTLSGGKVLANTSNTSYDLNVGTNGAGIYGTMYIFSQALYSYNGSSYYQFYNSSNVGQLKISDTSGSNYKGLTIDTGGTGNDSGRVKIDTQLGVNITSTSNWSTTPSAKLVVGKILSNTSSAAAQIHGGIRCTSWVVLHDPNNLNNSSYWYYTSGGLRTGAEGSGGQNVYAGGDVVAYYSSDPRLKKNKKKIKNPLKILDKINGYTFDWKNYAKNVGTHLVGSDYGVMADEIEEVMPELVEDRDNGYKGVKYEKIVPLLIECIKEQQVQINQLKKWKEDKKWI